MAGEHQSGLPRPPAVLAIRFATPIRSIWSEAQPPKLRGAGEACSDFAEFDSCFYLATAVNESFDRSAWIRRIGARLFDSLRLLFVDRCSPRPVILRGPSSGEKCRVVVA